MLTEASRGFRKESAPEVPPMIGVARPVVRHESVVQRLLETVPVWQRSEIRLTFALTDASVGDIARALDVDREAVLLITRSNPLDDPRRHKEMPRGRDGIRFTKEAVQMDKRVSGGSAQLDALWEQTIEELRQQSKGNALIDVASLTPEIGQQGSTERKLSDAAAALPASDRVAVRLAFAINRTVEIEDIAKALGIDKAIVYRLTRNSSGVSTAMNRGSLGIRQTKDFFTAEQAVGRGSPVKDEAGWLRTLIAVRRMKHKLLKNLDWRLVDLATKAEGLTNPLLISLETPK